MGEAAIDEAEGVGNLEKRESVTANLKLHDDGEELKEIEKQNPEACNLLHPDYPWSVADVIHAVRNQLAQKVEDVLSRRLRALPLNARAAEQMAAKTVQTMAEEMNQDDAWIEEQTQSFGSLVKMHLPNL
jgi:glycerol-3-phosphate dehydrogenase